MSNDKAMEPMLDMYIFETNQLIEQLEEITLSCEEKKDFTEDINEIFRIMHTIKGNSAMMLFDDIAILTHSTEDLFDFMRSCPNIRTDSSKIADILLKSVDFIKTELAKIKEGQKADGSIEQLNHCIKEYLTVLKDLDVQGECCNIEKKKESKKKVQFYISSSKEQDSKKTGERNYSVHIFFKEGCGMENIRAFTIINKLETKVKNLSYEPSDIIENNDSSEIIKAEGFKLKFTSEEHIDTIKKIINSGAFIKEATINYSEDEEDDAREKEIILEDDEINNQTNNKTNNETNNETNKKTNKELNQENSKNKFKEAQKSIDKKGNSKEDQEEKIKVNHPVLNVNVEKLDMLMDLVGELFIAESMVTRNPEIQGLQIDSFYKATRQLRKIVNNVQDVVMSIRMVPLSNIFRKMNRLVRDMSKKLDKGVILELIGEETEVDKNIIEHIGDPLMHLIRNAVDHGIEGREERISKGKPPQGKITLEAKNEGGDVWIKIKDDGRGLDTYNILKKALERGIVDKDPETMTDKEIFSLILLPGFSTNEEVTEFSGRGVGMDVVAKNLENIRGNLIIDSKKDKGTTINIKIPLTLAIIEGMTVRVGKSRYTIPITSIRESFRARKEDLIVDPQGREMIIIRDTCYEILRLHNIYNINTETFDLNKGIMIMIESEDKKICIFADELLGQQQVVVKPLPNYIKKIKGIAGCSLLGDGSTSLILDIEGVI